MSQLRNPYDFNEDDLNFKSHGAFSSGPDGIVQKTNDDAAISRLVASRLGYFDDKYVGAFVRKAEPRSPVFNRGTYIRFTAIMNTLRAFIKRYGKEAQIVSLGAGSDTKFFLLKVKYL
jgi:O-methyltransferase involved in polyketide biosynthesis